jgi:hypothetical protein
VLADKLVVMADQSIVMAAQSAVLPNWRTDYDATMVTGSYYVQSTLHLVQCIYNSQQGLVSQLPLQTDIE